MAKGKARASGWTPILTGRGQHGPAANRRQVWPRSDRGRPARGASPRRTASRTCATTCTRSTSATYIWRCCRPMTTAPCPALS